MIIRNPFIANQVHTNGSGFVDALLNKLSIVSRIDNSNMTVNENFQIDLYHDANAKGMAYGITGMNYHVATFPKLARDLSYLDYSDSVKGFERKVIYAFIEDLVGTSCYVEHCDGKFVDRAQYEKSIHRNVTQLSAFILAIFCKNRDVVTLGYAADGRPLGLLSQKQNITLLRPIIFDLASKFSIDGSVVSAMYAQWDDTNYVFNHSYGFLSTMSLLKQHIPDFIFEPHDVSDITTGILDTSLGMISENITDFSDNSKVKTVVLDTDIKPSIFDIAFNCVFSAKISASNTNLSIVSNFIYSSYVTPIKYSQYQSEILFVMYGVKSSNMKLQVQEEIQENVYINPKHKATFNTNLDSNSSPNSKFRKAKPSKNIKFDVDGVTEIVKSVLETAGNSVERRQALVDAAVGAMESVKRTGKQIMLENVLPAVLIKVAGPLMKKASQYGVGIKFNDAQNGIRIEPMLKILPGG